MLSNHAAIVVKRVYELDAKRLEKAGLYLDQIAAHWDDAADRLKPFVEGYRAVEDPALYAGIPVAS